MGGMTTVAARFKDGTITSFRINTGFYFDLCFTEEEFKKEMKDTSAEILPVRKENFLSKSDAEHKYESYDYGNNLLAPFSYGITFYDYLNKVVYTIGENISASEYSLAHFYSNPVYQALIKEKQQIREEHLDQLEEQLSYGYMKKILKFKELKELGAFYDLEDNHLISIQNMDTFEAYETFFDDEFFLISKYARLKVKLPEWTSYTLKDDYNHLYEYLDKQNILTDNDKLGWNLFYKQLQD